MSNRNFETTISVNKSPKDVFVAICNVRGWWSENIEGTTDQLDAEFIYGFKDVHVCKIKITAFEPGKKIVWLVLENHFNFTEDKSEWKGNRIIFEISEDGSHAKMRFTQEGLVPDYECYNVCRDAWTSYIQGSLKDLIEQGKGKPNTNEGGLNAELIDKWKLPVK